jgi:hypothetical protein
VTSAIWSTYNALFAYEVPVMCAVGNLMYSRAMCVCSIGSLSENFSMKEGPQLENEGFAYPCLYELISLFLDATTICTSNIESPCRNGRGL